MSELEDFLFAFKKEPEKKTPTPIAEQPIAKPKEEYKQVDEFLFVPIAKTETENVEKINTAITITNHVEENKQIVEASTPIAIEHNDSAIVNANKTIAIGKEKKKYGVRTPCSIESVMEQDEFESRFKTSGLDGQKACYVICIDLSGARKMEIATMKLDQFKLVKDGIELSIVRKKHSAQTKPILLHKDSFGVSEYVIPWYNYRVAHGKPSTKLIYHFHTEKGKIISEKLHTLDDGSTYIEKIRSKGKEITDSEYVKDVWMFPNVSKQTALSACKKVYGQNLYTHYGRARRLSILLSHPSANVTLAKSYSGIKSTRVIEKYMMQSEKQLKAAIDLVRADTTRVKDS
jgi:hypothetical protein